jgi:hypothetical protein
LRFKHRRRRYAFRHAAAGFNHEWTRIDANQEATVFNRPWERFVTAIPLENHSPQRHQGTK